MNKPVKFELAKLLKEKGFDEPCSHAYKEVESPVLYIHQDKKYNNSFKKEWQNTVRKNSHMDNAVIKRYSAPTIVEVVMWLYEKHGIWISIFSDTVLNWESLFSIKIDWIYPKDSPDSEDIEPKYFNYKGDNEFNSPTEAYEAAIEYTLNNLI